MPRDLGFEQELLRLEPAQLSGGEATGELGVLLHQTPLRLLQRVDARRERSTLVVFGLELRLGLLEGGLQCVDLGEELVALVEDRLVELDDVHSPFDRFLQAATAHP
ncbi:MAG TPA: hypothetical protein ENJ09_14900 [Planctomycetes bacterium]|nr:hypothetical protein [Planctomycetota bacterium]